MVEVCVVFTARERYSHAQKALEALYANAKVPFRLLIIDAATPQRYRRQIEAAVRGRPRVEFISCDKYLLPNQARNLAIASVREPFILFLENDCEILPGCLERLLAASQQRSAVAVPWLWEEGRRHFDVKLGSVTELESGELEILPAPDWTDPPPALERIGFFESHCFLIPRKSLEAAAPLDGELNVGELIDLSLALRRAGVEAVLVPGAGVEFFPPPPIRWDELAHYRLRWDVKRAESSLEAVRTRWRISNMRQSAQFARLQHYRVSRLLWGALMIRSRLGRYWRRVRPRIQAAFGGAPRAGSRL